VATESSTIELATEPELTGRMTTTSRPGAVESIRISDRIRELRRVPAKELLPNPKNWRLHPKAHAEALRGLLTESDYADAPLRVARADCCTFTPAPTSQRSDLALRIIDGDRPISRT
jgi:hypothetical protein